MVLKVTEIIDIPAKTKKVARYVCAICKTKYVCNFEATDCEKQHTCLHIDIDYCFVDHSIKAECFSCNKLFGEFYFDDMDDKPELVKEIWELIATHQGITLPIAPSSDST